jgi:endonuclease I
MKKIILLLTYIYCNFLMAQPPEGYYNSATGIGYTLKTQLHNIIKNSHTPQTYGDLWNLFTTSAFRDNYYENNNSLLDIYSEKPTGPDNYEYATTNQQCGNYTTEGDCYNREHLVPQSFFDNFLVEPMKSDPFHVFPSDGYVNGQRGNFPFGVVGTPNYTSSNSSKKGNNINTGYAAGYSSVVFEPIDEFKGDVARAFFYFTTRYEDLMANFYNAANITSCQAKAMFDGSTNKALASTFLNILYQWHLLDPVSTKEIAQNNAIYNFQSNRNPYIDNPLWIATVWGENLDIQEINLNIVNVYPNPTNQNFITIQSENIPQNIQLFNINGQLIQEINQPKFLDNRFILNDIAQGFYFLKLDFQNQMITKKIIIN